MLQHSEDLQLVRMRL